jgi:hypothetical protein
LTLPAFARTGRLRARKVFGRKIPRTPAERLGSIRRPNFMSLRHCEDRADSALPAGAYALGQPDFCGAQSIEYRLLINLVSNFCRQAVNLTPPGGSMATSTHLAELEQRHRMLDDELSDALQHPSVDDFTLAELKRRKLQLKDEMARLAHRECDSVH